MRRACRIRSCERATSVRARVQCQLARPHAGDASRRKRGADEFLMFGAAEVQVDLSLAGAGRASQCRGCAAEQAAALCCDGHRARGGAGWSASRRPALVWPWSRMPVGAFAEWKFVRFPVQQEAFKAKRRCSSRRRREAGERARCVGAKKFRISRASKENVSSPLPPEIATRSGCRSPSSCPSTSPVSSRRRHRLQLGENEAEKLAPPTCAWSGSRPTLVDAAGTRLVQTSLSHMPRGRIGCQVLCLHRREVDQTLNSRS